MARTYLITYEIKLNDTNFVKKLSNSGETANVSESIENAIYERPGEMNSIYRW